ncbi:hypothetical protein N7530_002865 [Penicillium desertorum]|uniref:Uncharacterized protein n=1 Tax=Penicillium desertorum TaxID=1303715 RepID=A0A9W9X5I8_9EURO|nr:hypothetical protein N7530_002865 [Penicillium desertorum]
MSSTPTISSRLIISVNDIPDGCKFRKSIEQIENGMDGSADCAVGWDGEVLRCLTYAAIDIRDKAKKKEREEKSEWETPSKASEKTKMPLPPGRPSKEGEHQMKWM